MRVPPYLLVVLFSSANAFCQDYTISTFAGGGVQTNIPGSAASLYNPQGVAVDGAGNVFFSDSGNSVVLRLDAKTGVLTLIAGNGTAGFSGDNGPATSAQLSGIVCCGPAGVAVDSTGNVYIADSLNGRIRKVSNGVITTVAGGGSSLGDNGPATSAQLRTPSGVAVDSNGNLYIADTGQYRIRKVANGIITTVAGNGTQGVGAENVLALSTPLNAPIGVTVDLAGNLYIADYGQAQPSTDRIRKVSNGVITTVAGGGSTLSVSGPATNVQLSIISGGIAVDSAGSLYFTEDGSGLGAVCKVSNGLITALAQGLNYPAGVAIDAGGNLYVADSRNSAVKTISSGVITTVAGNGSSAFTGDNGPATKAELNYPEGVALDPSGSLYISDVGSGRIRKVSNGVITAFAGGGDALGDNGPSTSAQLNGAYGIAADSSGSLYIADSGNSLIRKVTNGVITTIAGNGSFKFSGDNGPATGASLNQPQSVAVDSTGAVYIADLVNNRVRKVANGTITTVAGTGVANSSGDNGPAVNAQLNQPQSVVVDRAGTLYIGERDRVRKVSNGVITTVAGGGSNNSVDPAGLAVDSAGNLFIANFNLILKVTNGVVMTIAGTGGVAYDGDNGPATKASFYGSTGVALDPQGNVYFNDTGSRRIRLLTPIIPTINSGGIVPVYSTSPIIQSRSWISVYGNNLASGMSTWNGDFPTSLGGTSVTIDNKSAYLWFVSPTQINLQVPDDTTVGMVSVVVTTASGTATSTVTLAPQAPSFSLLSDGKHVAAEIPTPNGGGAYGGGTYDLVGPSGTFSFNTRPVKPGETLVLYGVGFGTTNPLVQAGKIFSGSAPTINPVIVTIGGVKAAVSYAGLIEAGLYQINVTVPSVASGEYSGPMNSDQAIS
jgi:uncharacterized protein (TIGR03437 family)